MLIYSESTFTFIAKCQSYLKQIIRNETDLKVNRSRFSFNSHTYPISIVTFTGLNKIGYFDGSNYQIGLNSNLMFSTKEPVLKDILRHEFAHYMTMIKYGDVLPHGEEFKQICSGYGWNKSISKATMDIQLSNNELVGDLKTEKVLTKVKNLLKLSESDNEHEAELATTKANQLIIKHNLEQMHLTEDDPLYVQEVFFAKKRNAKLSAIYSIISHFLVTPVMNYTSQGVRLEITGSKTNIELGEYIAEYLDRELDKLWALAKYKNNLKGLKQKNSFFSGVARGFDEKMLASQSDLSVVQAKDLVILKDDLRVKTDRIYGRLRSSTSQSSFDRSSLKLGQSAGKNLSINKGIKNKTNKLIGWLS